MEERTHSSFDDAGSLCRQCGLCCNGVIFARGELRPHEDADRFRAVGLRILPVTSEGVSLKFRQPCAVFDGYLCRIYAQRPLHCREFECLLLKRLKTGQIGWLTASRRVRRTRVVVDRVRSLLRTLGDENDRLPLAKRFRDTSRSLERGGASRRQAGLFADLTLAMHELNFALGRFFYPGGWPGLP